MRQSLAPGVVIASRYRLDRLLGAGGVGEVWAATHSVTSRRVAIKVLKERLSGDGVTRRRFFREARAASAVVHPNVVTVHDFFELEDGVLVMVMDLLDGETFRQRLARTSVLSLREAVDILLPVVSAVGTAHALGIVHRDLKPDNVFLVRPDAACLFSPKRDEPDVRVLDFGIAKLCGAADASGGATLRDGAPTTDAGALLGTPAYMSPEQVFGEPDVDHRADVWAIGVMVYEALSGCRPVDGENAGQVLKRLLEQGITPLEVVAPDVPPDVASLVGRMLSRDRDERPRDLREVRATLEPHGSARVRGFGAAVEEREAPRSSADAASSPLSAELPAAPPAERRAIRHGPALVLAVSAVALLSGWLAVRQSAPPSPPLAARTEAASPDVLPAAAVPVATSALPNVVEPARDAPLAARPEPPRPAARRPKERVRRVTPAEPQRAIAASAGGLVDEPPF